jgi:hypothetical protein
MARRKQPADEMLVGFFFPYNSMAGKEKDTPYTFLSDKETGLRPGEKQKPQGFVKVDLTRGIHGVTLPPLAVWKLGRWKDELSDVVKGKLGGAQLDGFTSWIVSGEGTPSNYEFRVYTLPDDVAATELPKHPMMWTPKQKQGQTLKAASSSHRGGYGSGYQAPASGYGGSAVSKPTQTPAATLPVGIRFRCPGCGHWWKESNLAPHTTSCCPGLNGGDSDWAIQCECCETLDEVSTCKPGFPRAPKVKEPEKEKEPVDFAEPVKS